MPQTRMTPPLLVSLLVSLLVAAFLVGCAGQQPAPASGPARGQPAEAVQEAARQEETEEGAASPSRGPAADRPAAEFAGSWRSLSARLFYDVGGGGSVTRPPRPLELLADGTWHYGSSQGTWAIRPITAQDWERWRQWAAADYGPSRKITLHGWNNDGLADGPVEESGGRVDFIWIGYRVGPPTVQAPGTVAVKFGRVNP